MDFHTLTRKKLQILCKRNKIPANVTNVAMADALKALENVEGLDEIQNQSQSPEKTTRMSSQEIPSTVTRTSTRRKPTKEEPQSTQLATRTRRITSKTIEFDDENKNVNLPETPALATTTRRRAQQTEHDVEEQKKGELPETPASRISRRRTRVGSTRRKVESQKEEESAQSGNGTRRSVRLLEKCVAGLSLKESGKVEHVKIDQMVEDVIEENENAQSGTTLEVPLARNLSVSLEDEKDLKDDVLESSKCCQYGKNYTTMTSETLYSLSALATNDASHDESDTYLPRSEDKLTDMPDGTIDPKRSDDVAVTEDFIDTCNTNEEPVAENVEDKTKPDMVAEALEEVSKEILGQASSENFMKPIEVLSGEDDQAPQESECQRFIGKDCDINVVMQDNYENDDVAKLPEDEEFAEGQVSQNLPVFPDSSEKLVSEKSEDDPDQVVDSDVDEDSGSDNNSLADELQKELQCETAAYHYENLMKDMVNEEALVDVHVSEIERIHVVETSPPKATQSVADKASADNSQDYDGAETLVNFPVKPAEEFAETTLQEMTDMANEEALVDVNVSEVERIQVVETLLPKATQSVVGKTSADRTQDYDDAEALVDVSIKPAEEFADTTLQEIPPPEKSPTAAKQTTDPYLVSNIAISSSILLSPPLTTQSFTPARLTPVKSSSKKQTTIPKITQISDNKENIKNNRVKEVEPSLEKKKKGINVIDEETVQNLDNMSLRYLKKLARKFNNLQISDDVMIKEDRKGNELPSGKIRPALQLQQNCGEAEKKN